MKHLSYSGYQKYVTCPKQYDYHYNQKLRPEAGQAHLTFGSAVDAALNSLLLGERKEKCLKGAEDILSKELFNVHTQVEEKDYDGEILTEANSALLLEKLRSFGWSGTNFDALATSLFQTMALGGQLSDNQKLSIKTLVFYSFLDKISLIIDAFQDYVMPQLEEVISVQTYVKRGILDFTAKFKGVDGVVICDNKTTSMDYKPDAVVNSVQLAGYGAEIGAYIVFNKTVRKNRTRVCSVCGASGTGKRHKTCDKEVNKVRCNGEWTETIRPEVVPQVIIDNISERTRNTVEEAYSNVELLINSEVFPRNLTACFKQFGKPCPYIKLCWEDDSSGLKQEPPKELK